MSKIEKEIIVKNQQGLHARPAALFVQIASKFKSKLNIIKDGEIINGKSIMSILMLEAHKDCKILLQAEGDDAQILIDELEKLLSQDHIQ